MKTTESKILLQEMIEKNFNGFLNIKVNNTSVAVLPLRQDIPVIESVRYDESKDMIEIMFKTTKESNLFSEGEEGLIKYYKDKNENIIGFQIYKIKELSLKNKKIRNSIDQVIDLELEKVKTASDMKQIMKTNIKRRSINFVKDLLKPSNIEKLIPA